MVLGFQAVIFSDRGLFDIIPANNTLARHYSNNLLFQTADWRDGGAQPLPLRQERHPALLPRVATEEAHLHVEGWIPVNLKYIIIATNQEEEAKLLYGMLFSMKSFVAKLSPNDMKQGFLSYVTSAYRCRGKAIKIP